MSQWKTLEFEKKKNFMKIQSIFLLRYEYRLIYSKYYTLLQKIPKISKIK